MATSLKSMNTCSGHNLVFGEIELQYFPTRSSEVADSDPAGQNPLLISAGGDHFSDNAFAMGFGGGIDVNAGDRFAIRLVQFDWIPNRMGGEWSTSEFRLGFGVVFRGGN